LNTPTPATPSVIALNPGRATAGLGISALLLTAGLNWQHLAWWCLPLLVLASALHFRATLRGQALPGGMARLGLALILTAGVLASFRTLNGLAAGATLLAAMTAAKLFEARAIRDWYVIVGATLFLLLAACLDRQQLWRLPLYAVSLWLSAAALRGLNGGTAQPAPTLLRDSGRQLLYALPLAIVFFLFFPRLPGAFWSLSGDDSAITGLADQMSPGSLARLTESDEPALRARFDGALPPAPERYWRGPVLHDFDGFSWRRHRGLPAGPDAAQFRGTAYRYSLTLEPNSHRTVVALELADPAGAPFAEFTDDFQLISHRPLTQRQSFEFISYPHALRGGELSAEARRVDLVLPADRNPRSRALALRLRAAAPDDAAFVRSVLNYLRAGGFVYTLTPQLLGRDSVDDLLFRTRQGFCGHYASAFVDLMRAGGVPARVVTGYLGGAWNPIGGYLLVRQADAHAWAEVWLSGRGWVRADPTAMVAPERLNRELLQFGAGAGESGFRLGGASQWMTALLQSWDALNAWWQDDVVGFNFARQLNLADWLGFGDRDWQTLAIALGAGMSAWLLWIAWSLRRLARASRPDALERAWRRIDRRARRAGYPRAPPEGVLDYCERLARTHPAAAAVLAPLARRYALLRYGPDAPAAELREFQRAAWRFRFPRA
jgi:transglutaminase-like putative cysteine protease